MGVCDDIAPGACDAIFIVFMCLLSLIGCMCMWKCCISPCITNCFLLSDALEMTPEERDEAIKKKADRKARNDELTLLARQSDEMFARVRDRTVINAKI
jgi:hypothetical protein